MFVLRQHNAGWIYNVNIACLIQLLKMWQS
jgi:hypothetical protein